MFDHVFTNDCASVGAYAPAAHYLPLASSTRYAVLEKDADYDYDVAFVGSAWPNRVTFLRKLLRHRSDLRIRICLSYNEHVPNVYLDLPESSYIGNVSHVDFLSIANRARINLALHRRFSGDGRGLRSRSPGPRLFEAALAGGFQLVDGDGMSLDGLYRAGKDIVAFDGFDDCAVKMDSLLANPKRRMAMAREAQRRTAHEHTYAARVTSIFDRVLPHTLHSPVVLKAVPSEVVRKRLLFVTHNQLAHGNFGGVEVYQETIANQMRSSHETFYYQPQLSSNSATSRHYVLTDSRHRILREVSVPAFDPVTTLWQRESEDAFASMLCEFAIDLVHFHHMINHSASLPIVCRVMGVPTVYTFQDFWTVCSRFNLIDNRRQYCRIHERSQTVCDVCLETADGCPSGSQGVRRSFFSQVLTSIDRVVFNSASSAAVCRQIFPELPQSSYVHLGLPLPWATMHRNSPVRDSLSSADRQSPLRAVFLGNFTFGKGAETFLHLARFMQRENVSFTIAGRVDTDYVERLKQESAPNVTVEGGFAPGTLDLSRFDVSLHLSVWPETYCITLSEAWEAGVVPIVSACGALADRVHQGSMGSRCRSTG